MRMDEDEDDDGVFPTRVARLGLGAGGFEMPRVNPRLVWISRLTLYASSELADAVIPSRSIGRTRGDNAFSDHGNSPWSVGKWKV
jgi:hypothetical protein